MTICAMKAGAADLMRWISQEHMNEMKRIFKNIRKFLLVVLAGLFAFCL